MDWAASEPGTVAMGQWVVGNWKMNGSTAMLADYVPALREGLGALEGWQDAVEVGVCPPFPYLGATVERFGTVGVLVGAQDVDARPAGAFTGAVAVPMLKELGVRLCIVGHSERRQHFGETDAGVRGKAAALLEGGLLPIVCVGETLDEREAGRHHAVVEQQVLGALEGLGGEAAAHLIIAYEPVWAIGTGVNATPEQANEMHGHIRTLLVQRFGSAEADAVPILYGGSVSPDNAGALLGQPQINGALVGGASLKPEAFLAIIRQCLS